MRTVEKGAKGTGITSLWIQINSSADQRQGSSRLDRQITCNQISQRFYAPKPQIKLAQISNWGRVGLGVDTPQHNPLLALLVHQARHPRSYLWHPVPNPSVTVLMKDRYGHRNQSIHIFKLHPRCAVGIGFRHLAKVQTTLTLAAVPR